MSRLSTMALVATALAGAPALAAAQSTDPYNPSRFSIEGYLSHMWLETDANTDREPQGGFGVRAMFNRSDASEALSGFFQRARAGAFFTYNGEQGDAEVKSIHYGVQADFPLLAAPSEPNTGFRIDPFVSLGLGLLNSSRPSGAAGTRISSNDFALTPAIGTLIPITGEIKFRGDLRAPFVFGEGRTSTNFAVEGGISIGF